MNMNCSDLLKDFFKKQVNMTLGLHFGRSQR